MIYPIILYLNMMNSLYCVPVIKYPCAEKNTSQISTTNKVINTAAWESLEPRDISNGIVTSVVVIFNLYLILSKAMQDNCSPSNATKIWLHNMYMQVKGTH